MKAYALTILAISLFSAFNDVNPLRHVNSDSNATFLYYAYGSNLNEQRIHIHCKTARRQGIGNVHGWRLDFGHYNKHWKGYVATIVPDQAEEVWGAIWELDISDMKKLDRQEEVPGKVYKVFNVTVTKPDGDKVVTRTYCLVHQPDPPKVPHIPNLKPSKKYLDTIIIGAKQSGLPQDYIKMLEAIPPLRGQSKKNNFFDFFS